MCLVFYTSSTRVSFISPMSAALSCLPCITLPSLNGSPPPDDDDDAAGDDNDEQGKTYYLIHTGNWQRNCRKECKKKNAKKVKIKKPTLPLFAIPFSSFKYTHSFSFSFSFSQSSQDSVYNQLIKQSSDRSFCLYFCLSIFLLLSPELP